MENWFLDKIEIKNLSTNETTVFPCNRWLSKEKEDGEIGRDLFPEISEDRSREAPRNPQRDSRFGDRLDFQEQPKRAKEWERTNSLMDDRMMNERMTRENRSDNFVERGQRNSIRSERDVTRERERDMYSRSPRRSDYF